jgi:acetyl-CoA carboxylase biotin carboxylase subunit
VLIPNRGEIALRLLRACRELGIETVVAHSEADRGAPWLAAADRAVCLGPAPASASYLNQTAILQVAEQEHCQALHPGYGFLSENATFAARCAQQGITFVGPSAGALQLLGDKSAAKRSLAAAGLDPIPGSAGVLSGPAEALAVASDIGYPVLLKATAGGGGKGMRLCRDASSLDAAFAEASIEADKAFGERGLYLEKLLVGARHVEFQVLVDGYGQSLHLGERECSIQRQHQKLVEEAPSPVVDAALRDRMGRRAAEALARLGYRGAGTVEFLRDADGRFYFMEVNARLQVEHPVTEMLTGVDLVAEQLRIAANQRLALVARPDPFQGHAIEFRINAEDPARQFRPDPGRIERFRPPPAEGSGVRVRWDSAICEGYRVPPHYDSLLGKLIVHAADRQTALAGARRALAGMVVEGVRTTRDLHLRLLEDAGFCSGRYDIHYLRDSGLVAAPQGGVAGD